MQLTHSLRRSCLSFLQGRPQLRRLRSKQGPSSSICGTSRPGVPLLAAMPLPKPAARGCVGSLRAFSSNQQHVQTVTSEFLSAAEDLPPGTHLHLIVLNYVLPQQTAQLWKRATTRICADGGANRLYDQIADMLPGLDPHTARSSFLPDLIKGDLDSVRPDVQAFYTSRGVPMIDLSSDQETTDLEKCLLFLEGRLRALSQQQQQQHTTTPCHQQQQQQEAAVAAVAAAAPAAGAAGATGAPGYVSPQAAAAPVVHAPLTPGSSSSRSDACAASNNGSSLSSSSTSTASPGTAAAAAGEAGGAAGGGMYNCSNGAQQQQQHDYDTHHHRQHHQQQQQRQQQPAVVMQLVSQDMLQGMAANGAHHHHHQQQQLPPTSWKRVLPHASAQQQQQQQQGGSSQQSLQNGGGLGSSNSSSSDTVRREGGGSSGSVSGWGGVGSDGGVVEVAASVLASCEVAGEPSSKRLQQEHIILVLGALGGRLDHTLSNLNTLYCYRHLNMALWGDGNLVRLLRAGTAVIHPGRTEGPTCGLVPLARPATASSSGLKWDLDNTHMCFRGLLSTSNVIASDTITVATDEDLLWITAVEDTRGSSSNSSRALRQ